MSAVCAKRCRDDLIASLPPLRPNYRQKAFSNYGYLDEVGNSEKDDPYHFGITLLKDIRRCPGQEIATHTFWHYYCLEEGQTPDQFKADIDAAVAVAVRQGIELGV